ncbi:hypothetical protein FA95DRAFT_1603935 [Auriscalpium vulgare]|uniref:Uncharacterized protein n=1 Tax=Auriscalpium vulgare TaxID=40419 RepID=A0ACB8S0Q4_9AGAM|nr:hypothetical protein FA95DRAFT_1603935 [Auriscalpium vulgare]
MASFPLEIQMLIIEFVYRSSQHAVVDYNTLRACALVCRVWTPPAQRLLFRRVLHSRHTVQLLLPTLRASPQLAALVHTVCFPLSFDWGRTSANSADSVALLELSPDVVVFMCDVFGSAWSEVLECLCADPLHPAILEIKGEAGLIARFAQLYPGLRAIDVHHITVHQITVEDVGASPQVHMSNTVQSLAVHAYSLDWLFEPDKVLPALRELELRNPDWADTAWCQRLRLRASNGLPQLRVLSIQGHFPPTEVLEQLPQLEVLVFDDFPVRAIALPRSLRHLAFHCHDHGHEQEHGAGFLAGALSGLPELQIVTVIRRVPPPESHVLLEATCRDLGVEFATYETQEHFPRVRHVDWI